MFGRLRTRDRVVLQVLATLIAIPFAYPIIVIVATSFEGQGAIENYTAVLTRTPFLRFLANSAIIAGGTIVITFVCTMLAAYAFSKLRFPGRQMLFVVVLGGLVLPAIALIVPIFTIMLGLGLMNTHIAVILPLAAITIPFTVLLAKNFLDGVPDEILEAAKIDGANTLGTLFWIVLPLARPIIAVVLVWTFLQSWNEFFLPLLLLQSSDMQAVTQVPLYFTSEYGSDTPKIFASLVLISLPVTIAYLSLQKLFERGLTAGAVK
ncbi:carbohydrate ABC transporter permease [Agromyces sp. CCNWLW203]|uniref:carbohydrate ABC transporter permease n=1 Tax=Agromyces sp. CCNWLW203 TaxID=3112842 RepID=UPI002F969A06